MSEAPGVRYSNTTGSQWLCPCLESSCQYMGDFRTGITCVSHGKLVPKRLSHVAVNQKEQEGGEVKNTSNCYRRTDETPAKRSLEAA